MVAANGKGVDKPLSGMVLLLSKIRRGGYVFVTWIGDHAPYHVHVYRHGRLELKWDLESGCAMAGRPTHRLLRLIRALQAEGRL